MERPIFTPEFFYDEVREGFYVPEMMKRSWAAQITILYEIDRICERHGITWFADMGTMLGTVRHKGFIPWDDDLDISMTRENWERFFALAPEELPEGFEVMSNRTNEEYTLSLGRIANAHGIRTDRKHMEQFQGCPYVTGVDIFPIDRIYKDPEKERDRKRRAKEIHRLMQLLASEGMDSEKTLEVLEGVERDNQIGLPRVESTLRRELVLLFERICMECRDSDHEEVAFMNTWLLHDWMNCPKAYYEKGILLPFENISMSVPENYDGILTIYYHDYRTIRKGGGVHAYPLYGEQEQILKQELGRNPYRYTFRPEDLHMERREKTFREKCMEILSLAEKAIPQIRVLTSQGDTTNSEKLLTGCQDLAIALGTMLEEKYSERCEGIEELEDFCELLYTASQQWTEATDEILGRSLNSIRCVVEALLQNSRPEVVFLPCRALWWDTMKGMYESLSSDETMTVHVMPIPFLDRNPYGENGMTRDESEFFRKMPGYMDRIGYDIAKRHPEVIVMQLPFDGSGGAITVADQYYSTHLLQCCDELWYIPCFAPDAPESMDDKAAKSISVLVEQPAVIHADRVFLPDEGMKSFYIDKLTELAGEATRTYWEGKIHTI